MPIRSSCIFCKYLFRLTIIQKLFLYFMTINVVLLLFFLAIIVFHFCFNINKIVQMLCDYRDVIEYYKN